MHNGGSCFLVCSGPSLNKLDLSKLNNAGIYTVGINNSVRTFRPNAFVSVDDPANFIMSIWHDPKITKFTMFGKRNKQLWDNNKWKESKLIVSDCPNIVYYKDNEHLKYSEEWLKEETINWGNHTHRCENCGQMRPVPEKGRAPRECPNCKCTDFGCRSVMLAALKIIYVLGFRKAFIIGADFTMTDDNKYAFNQERSSGSMKNNNVTYRKLNARFDKMRPIFERNGYYVFNATPNSNLNSFVKIDYEDAIKIAAAGFENVDKERTFGMYERKAVDGNLEKHKNRINEIKDQLVKINGNRPLLTKRLNKRLEQAQVKFTDALHEKERLLTWTA